MQPQDNTNQDWQDKVPAADADGYYGDEGGDGEVDLSFLDEKPQE